MRLCLWVALLLTGLAVAAEDSKTVLVVTAHAEDYLLGAGGTLARLIDEGYTVSVVQVTNDEKNSAGLGPAETRRANEQEGAAAARLLGAKEVIHLGHKSGELGYISSTELRNEMFTLIRALKPRLLFIPDPYIHYDPERDHFYTGKMAEEAWGYSGGGTFSHELARAGLPGYSAPEIYYFAVRRPYWAGEGGEGKAQFRPVDITNTFERKVKALEALRTARTPGRAELEELAAAIGKKHGFRYGEEFNYVGVDRELPPHVRERAVDVR